MYTFEDILEPLPYCDRFHSVAPLPEGVVFFDEGKTGFIPPRLSVREEGTNLGQAKVLIISAPGAVGKSTLAREIGFRKSALLWDLSTANEVGASSLEGMLSKTFAAEKGDFAEYLSAGLQFVVIDALDEGRTKVNENSFRSMLRDVGDVAKASSGTCFVLRGRTQIAEDCWLVLEDQGVSTSLLSIEPFNRAEADTYIQTVLNKMKIEGLVAECRDLIFEHLAISVTEDGARETADKFLHYPPVLDVVARLLQQEANPLVLKNALTASTSAIQGRAIKLLLQVMDRILDREAYKVRPSLEQAINEPMTQEQLSSAYNSNEQCKRLLASVFKMQVSASPEGLSAESRKKYEEAVGTWVSEHPFLQGLADADSVFKAYLYAQGLHGTLGDDLKQVTSTDLLNPEARKSMRLLAEFFLANSSLEERLEIQPDHLGILYDSLLSSESIHDKLYLEVDGPDEIGQDGFVRIDGEFDFLLNANGLIPYRSIPFTMRVTEGSTLFFGRSLRHSHIAVPCQMVLGNAGKEFQIGPDVRLNVTHMRIESDSLVVHGNPRQQTNPDVTVIEALTCESPRLGLPIVYEPTAFAVSWENDSRFPWTDYRMQRDESSFDSEDLRKTYMRFRRIAQTLRSHGNGALAKTRIKIEDERVMRGALGRTLLSQLRNDGILVLKDGFYFWGPANAAEHLGVSWGNLSRGECPPSLQAYLTKFIARNPGLFR